MSKFKLAAIDIDDTLLGPDKRISVENRAALQEMQKAGIKVILASGRGHADMLSFQNELGLNDFMVSCQGAEAKHPATGQVLQQIFLPQAPAQKIIDEGLKNGLTLFCYTPEYVAANQASSWVEMFQKFSPTEPLQVIDFSKLDSSRIFKIMWAAEKEQIDRFATEVKAWLAPELHSLITFPFFLEFASNLATKATGVEVVAKHYSIQREEVIAFGDGNNDAAVLEWAGLGVAMPCGTPAAKAAANVVAPDGDPETALARAIQYVLSL